MFLAHKSDVPHNLIKPLIQFDKKKSLLNSNGFKVVNNICPHQGSLILTELSNKFKCSYHSWSWNSNGEPVDSGTTQVCNNFKLSMKPAIETNSLIFTEKIDLNEISGIDLDFMVLQETRVDAVKTTYKNIIDVFLDVDHIPVVHENVYDDLGIGTDVLWKYYNWGSIQFVEKSTEYSQEFKDTLKDMPEQVLAAFWITVYPYTTIEWQPGAMFVNVCVPRDTGTDVCVFKYRDTRYNDKNWEINSGIWETAWAQDKTQSENIVARSMHYPHLETSKIHFREWAEK
jgi:phenylpropionate dioxygenase-like ring-hydroxylating dioxygenase large terminal subunit